MTTEQVPQPDRSQLDRIEGSLRHIDSQLSQILERMARMEERQDSQAAEVSAQRALLQEHSSQIKALEVSHAVIKSLAETSETRGDHRWGNLGSVGLVILGSFFPLLGYLITYFF